jgi:bifunctional DNA-binding transcriptional regulator/antitoxin component of YhaV-PrlF toxin-antitoxin module
MRNTPVVAKYQQTQKIRAMSKVYQRGKTQIPSEVRRDMGVQDDDRLLWILKNGKWFIEKA